MITVTNTEDLNLLIKRKKDLGTFYKKKLFFRKSLKIDIDKGC